MKVQTSCFDVARRFLGVRETMGLVDNPLIMAMLRLDNEWPEHDEVPWCSAFANFPPFLLGLPRSHSLQARSWLQVGTLITLDRAEPENDVVVIERGPAPLGHVGFFAAAGEGLVSILGGNQGNAVSIATFPTERILGVRRLL